MYFRYRINFSRVCRHEVSRVRLHTTLAMFHTTEVQCVVRDQLVYAPDFIRVDSDYFSMVARVYSSHDTMLEADVLTTSWLRTIAELRNNERKVIFVPLIEAQCVVRDRAVNCARLHKRLSRLFYHNSAIL